MSTPKASLPTVLEDGRGGEDGFAPPPPHNDDLVAALPPWRRSVILFTICWMCLPMAFLSSAILSTMPEIAATFNTSTTRISTANALVMVAMALSALVWLPAAAVLGRRRAYLLANAVLVACSVGCALAPNLACLTVFWVVGGTTGPFFLVAGQTILSDIFEPTVRGTAVGFFLGSSVSSQSLSPLISSVIATYTSWRVIFGTLGGITLVGFILAFFFVPRARELSNLSTQESVGKKWTVGEVFHAFNPAPVFRQWKYPGIILSNFACGFLSFNQYAILSSVRHIINPLFNLTSPLQSGLFFLAPGVGFLLGSIVGGHVSDRIVKRYMAKRDVRIPEDRLNSTPPWVLVVLPLGTLLYGWSVQRKLGGMGLPISASFILGFGLMASFSGLNTYAAESNPEFKTSVIAGKYIVQYSFSALSVGIVVPLIDAIGVGWTFTIATFSTTLAGIFVLLVARCCVRESPGKPRRRLAFPSRLP